MFDLLSCTPFRPFFGGRRRRRIQGRIYGRRRQFITVPDKSDRVTEGKQRPDFFCSCDNASNSRSSCGGKNKSVYFVQEVFLTADPVITDKL